MAPAVHKDPRVSDEDQLYRYVGIPIYLHIYAQHYGRISGVVNTFCYMFLLHVDLTLPCDTCTGNHYNFKKSRPTMQQQKVIPILGGVIERSSQDTASAGPMKIGPAAACVTPKEGKAKASVHVVRHSSTGKTHPEQRHTLS